MGILYLEKKDNIELKGFDFEKFMVNVATEIDYANVCLNFFPCFLVRLDFWGIFVCICFSSMQTPLIIVVFLRI